MKRLLFGLLLVASPVQAQGLADALNRFTAGMKAAEAEQTEQHIREEQLNLLRAERLRIQHETIYGHPYRPPQRDRSADALEAIQRGLERQAEDKFWEIKPIE